MSKREIKNAEDKLLSKGAEEAEDCLKKLNPCTEKGKQRIEEVEGKCSDWFGSTFRCMDHDKCVIFIRDISLRNMKAADHISNMDIFVELSFETFPKDGVKYPEIFVHRTEVKLGARDAQLNYPMRGNVHINTTVPAVKSNYLSIKVFDKNPVLGECSIGETRIKLGDLLIEWDQDVQVPLEFAKGGFSAGGGSICMYLAAPFNFLTCGLPTCGMDCSTEGDACCGAPAPACCAPDHKDSCCNRPSCPNCFGCLHPDSLGRCHCPTGEKCCSCNAPECSFLDPSRPSLLNCCGCLMSDCCAADGKGTVGEFKSCGKCGIPTFSMACPCYHWGNCAILPCKCDGGECEFLDCTKDLTCNGCQPSNPWDIEEKAFDKAHVYFSDAHLVTTEGKVYPTNAKFILEFGTWKWSSEGHGAKCERGSWKGMQQVAFADSSDSIKHNNLVVKVQEDTILAKTIGEGEISLVSLLTGGFHHEMTIEMPIAVGEGKNRKPTAKFVITCFLQSEHMKPQKRTAQAGTRVSITGRQKRSSILYKQNPEEIKDKLTADHFVEIKERNITVDEEKELIADSLTNEDILVGYQIELFSKSTRKSKGIWVICGIKTYRLSSTSYELKNREGVSRWDIIQKEVNGKTEVSGKPVTIKRKVAVF